MCLIDLAAVRLFLSVEKDKAKSRPLTKFPYFQNGRICDGRHKVPCRFISAVKMLLTALPLGVRSARRLPEREKGKQARWGRGVGSCHMAGMRQFCGALVIRK